jgi:hypothetical protein
MVGVYGVILSEAKEAMAAFRLLRFAQDDMWALLSGTYRFAQ